MVFWTDYYEAWPIMPDLYQAYATTPDATVASVATLKRMVKERGK